MNSNNFRLGRFFYASTFVLLAACGGGGGGGGGDGGGDSGGTGGTGGGGSEPTAEYNCDGSGSVTVSGTARYEFVPAVEGGAGGVYLDFNNSSMRPIRQAEVQAICPDGKSTYASTYTDAAGAYSLTVPENVDVVIRVRAAMKASGGPSWNVEVVDNTQDQAVWAAEGNELDSGTGSMTVNLAAKYDDNRASGPFAILDSVYTAMSRVLDGDADANFPKLTLNWSTLNSTCDGIDYPFADGCIGTSFFFNLGSSGGRNIFILGNTGTDADEYDNHVVIHEWGHYYEDAFARSDSIGGAHSNGNKLDPRVAFGEGWGNAWAGIATNDPVYVDVNGATSDEGFSFDVEDAEGKYLNEAGGWWSETTVQELIYDFYDGVNDDGVALGFAPLHTALTTQQRTTAAMTTIFSLVHYLKTNGTVAEQDAIDALLIEHDISKVIDIWGNGRGANDDGTDDFGTNVYFSPLHDVIGTVSDNSTKTNICTAQSATSSNSTHNRLGVRRFLRFTPDTSGEWLITLDSDIDDGNSKLSDPDFAIFLKGEDVTEGYSGQDYSVLDPDDPEYTGENGDGLTEQLEVATVTLTKDVEYVIEVLDWMNADDDSATGGNNVCLDLTFDYQP